MKVIMKRQEYEEFGIYLTGEEVPLETFKSRKEMEKYALANDMAFYTRDGDFIWKDNYGFGYTYEVRYV